MSSFRGEVGLVAAQRFGVWYLSGFGVLDWRGTASSVIGSRLLVEA